MVQAALNMARKAETRAGYAEGELLRSDRALLNAVHSSVLSSRTSADWVTQQVSATFGSTVGAPVVQTTTGGRSLATEAPIVSSGSGAVMPPATP